MRFPGSGKGWRLVGGLAVLAITGVLGLRYVANRPGPRLDHPLRIGFEVNPPVQIRSAEGYTGLAVDTVNEAARRAGVRLEWVETGVSSQESLRRKLVDLWPLMVNLPERRKYVHFPR